MHMDMELMRHCGRSPSMHMDELLEALWEIPICAHGHGADGGFRGGGDNI